MNVIFLSSSAADVRWFTRYYRYVFPAGSPRGRARLERSLTVLSDNPEAGREIALGIRQYTVLAMPFSLIYEIVEDRIEILRLWDGRADRNALKPTGEGPPQE